MARPSVEGAELTLEQLQEITGKAEPFEALHSYLQRATTPADLRAAGAAIKKLVAETLDDEEAGQLRNRFIVLMASCQHEVKGEQLNGRRVTITRAKFTGTKVGPTFRLRGTFEEAGKEREFECWMPGSSVGPVFRFFESRAHDAYPVDVCFRLEPHPRDPDKTMWTVEELAPRRNTTRPGLVPF